MTTKRSHLVARKLPDKTGKLVTRWVKEDSPSNQATPIPAPVTPASVDSLAALRKDRLEAQIAEFDLDEYLPEGPLVIGSTDDLRDNFYQMSADMQERFISAWEGYDLGYEDTKGLYIIVDTIYGEKSQVQSADRDTVLSNFMDIMPTRAMLPEEDDDDGPASLPYTMALFKSVGGYEHSKPFTTEQREVYRNAAYILYRIAPDPLSDDLGKHGLKLGDELTESWSHHRQKREAHRELLLKDMQVIDVLREHSESLPLLYERIASRGSLDPEIVRSVISSGAVYEGVL